MCMRAGVHTGRACTCSHLRSDANADTSLFQDVGTTLEGRTPAAPSPERSNPNKKEYVPYGGYVAGQIRQHVQVRRFGS